MKAKRSIYWEVYDTRLDYIGARKLRNLYLNMLDVLKNNYPKKDIKLTVIDIYELPRSHELVMEFDYNFQ